MRRRASGALVLGLAALVVPAARLRAQQRPVLDVTLWSGSAPAAAVAVRDLLTDRVIAALESGFPLYVHYRVSLRETGGLFDRRVEDQEWEHEYVVLRDPVREVYVIEEPSKREGLRSRDTLAHRLATVYVVGLNPDRPGRYYYQAEVEVRTLSDQDVDEAFAWLKGERGDSGRSQRPGLFTRTARRLLVRVMPLPSYQLEAKSREFAYTPR